MLLFHALMRLSESERVQKGGPLLLHHGRTVAVVPSLFYDIQGRHKARPPVRGSRARFPLSEVAILCVSAFD